MVKKRRPKKIGKEVERDEKQRGEEDGEEAQRARREVIRKEEREEGEWDDAGRARE